MKEIKFRGKRVDNGEWVYGGYCSNSLISTKRNGIIAFGGKGEFHVYAIEVIPETVGQFTSLKDKNGKEIYEGDIVRRFSITKIVEYKTGKSFCGFNIGTGYNYKKSGNAMEIIGNIYENPELITD